jgi:hypothetical protein
MTTNTNAPTPELDAIEDQNAQGGCLQQACSPVSETPETDAALVDHMPKDATEWSEHYLALSIHARKLERERDAARIPICIGRPIIEILAKEGMWTSMNGNSVVAADCLFGRNPYQEPIKLTGSRGAENSTEGTES